MRDLRIINDATGDVLFKVYGASEDIGLMLLQRLYIMLLSDQTSPYRGGAGYTLLNLLNGANKPADGVMSSVLAIACANAVKMLDADDRAKIKAFTGTCNDGIITCTLSLTDGTTLKGQLVYE